jgi:hypothetical protein
MKSKQVKLVIVDGCGSELLDVVMATVNYELSGDGAVLVHTDDLNLGGEGTHSHVEKILEYLNDPKRNDGGPVSIPYEGLILLRR